MRVRNVSFFVKLICMLMCLLFLFSVFSVNAHEFTPSRYPNDIRFHTYMKKMVACITYNWSNVHDENYRLRLRDAIGDWEWMDNGHVSLSETSSSNAYVMCYDTWPSSLPLNVYGATNATGYANQTIYKYSVSNGFLNSSPGSINGVIKLTKCNVYINKKTTNGWANHDIQKTWSHEIGHTLGLNETNDGTQSVMRQGRGSTLGWENYWKPQTHDTSDLTRFNYKSWVSSNVPTIG